MKSRVPQKQSDNTPKASQNDGTSTATAPQSNAVMQERLAENPPDNFMSMLGEESNETGMMDPTSLYLWATRTAGLYDNTGYDTSAYDTASDERDAAHKSGRDARNASRVDRLHSGPLGEWFQKKGIGFSWAKAENDLQTPDQRKEGETVPLSRTKDGATQKAETYYGTSTPKLSTSVQNNGQASYKTTDADLSKNGDVHTVKTNKNTTITHQDTASFTKGPGGSMAPTYTMNTVTGTTDKQDAAQTQKNIHNAFEKAKARYQVAMGTHPEGSPLHTAAKQELDRVKRLQERLKSDPSGHDHLAAEAARLGFPVDEARKSNSTTVTQGDEYSKGLLTRKNLTKTTGETDTTKTSHEHGFVSKKGVDWSKKRLGTGTDTKDNRTSEVTDDTGYTHKKTQTNEISRFRGIDKDKWLVLRDNSYTKASSDSRTGERKSETGSGGINLKDGLHKGRTQETRDANGNVNKNDISGKLNADGATGKTSITEGKETDHTKVMTTASADGAFTVKMVPIKGKKGTYKLITTMRVGVGLKRTSEVNSDKRDDHPDANNNSGTKSKISAGANGSASAQLTHTRVLDASTAKKYMADIDVYLKKGEAAGVPKALVPQLEQLKKARAWAKEDGNIKGMASALGSGSQAKNMATGDEVSLVLQGSAGGNLSAGSGGQSLGVEGSESIQRTLTVKRLPKNKTQLVVSFSDSSMRGVNGSVSQGAASGSMSDKTTEGSGQSVTFVLSDADGNFDYKYAQISGTATRSGLLTLRETFMKDVTEATASKSSGDSRDGSASLGPAALKVGQSSSMTEALTVKKDAKGNDQTSYKATGSNSSKASVNLGKYVEFGSKSTESADANVDKDGNVSVDISDKTETTGLANPFDKLPANGSELFKRMKAFDKELKKTEAHLATFKLDPKDVRFLVANAGQAGEWQRHAAWYGPAPFKAWVGLSSRLQNPVRAKEWAGIDTAKVRQLSHAKAIATFMRTAQGDGREIIESAVRNWGSPSLTGGHKGEFPAGMALTSKQYEAIRADGDTIGERMMAYVKSYGATTEDGQSDRSAAIPGLLKMNAALGDREASARVAVLNCTTFTSADTKAEMLETLSGVADARSAGYQAAYVEAVGNDTQTLGADDPTMTAFREAAQRRQLAQTLTICTALKSEETRNLSAAEEELDSTFSVDAAVVNAALESVEKSWQRWMAQVKKARTLYRALDMTPTAWKVSQDTEAVRSKTHEPDIDRYNAASLASTSAWKESEKKRGVDRKTRLTTY